MIYNLEIFDEDFKFLKEKFNKGCYTVNRYNDEHVQLCYRLIENGIIKAKPYYGEEGCYHPTYELTKLGKKVYETNS